MLAGTVVAALLAALFLSAASGDAAPGRAGGCIASLAPALFKYFPSAGGTGTVKVVPAEGRTWTASPRDSWIEVLPEGTGSGPGTFTFRAKPNPDPFGTSFRRGAVRVGCSVSEWQDVLVWQVPDCRTTIEWASGSPRSFTAAGGRGGVWVVTDSPYTCPWQAISQVRWITILTGPERTGEGAVNFDVAPNPAGTPRTGTLLIGEKPWQVTQAGRE